MRWLRVHADVLQNSLDLRALGDEGMLEVELLASGLLARRRVNGVTGQWGQRVNGARSQYC